MAETKSSLVHCILGTLRLYSAHYYGGDRKYNLEIGKQLVRETFLKYHHEQQQNIHLNVSILKKHCSLKFSFLA